MPTATVDDEVNAHTGGWTDIGGTCHPAHCPASQPTEGAAQQRERQGGRPGVGQLPLKEVIMTHISTTTAAVGTR